jgi:hypothetical protein
LAHIARTLSHGHLDARPDNWLTDLIQTVHKGGGAIIRSHRVRDLSCTLSTGTRVGQKFPICDGVPVVWRLPSPPSAARYASHAVNTHHHHWSNHAVASGCAGQQKPSLAGYIFRLTRTTPAYYPAASSPPSKASAACERGTPAAGGAPSGRRGWRPWPCES